MIDKTSLTQRQRNIRIMIRSFLLTASLEDLVEELEISLELGDTFRADCIRELMAEESD